MGPTGPNNRASAEKVRLADAPDFDDPTGLLEIMPKALAHPWRTVVAGECLVAG